MDLLTIIANEFDIPMIYSKHKVWFFRTKAGKFYNDFLHNNFIALGWDLIDPKLITDTKKSKDNKKAQIELLYPDEKRPGLILGQMEVFYNEMKTGDYIVIPSEGSKEITIGKIGDLLEEVFRASAEEEYPICSFLHKRRVEWIKTVDSWQDVYLFKALRAQQTISDITAEGKLVLRNLYPIYISGEFIHLTLQKSSDEEMNLACNVDLLHSILSIADKTASMYGKQSFRNEMSLKTAVGSPGFFEIILPGVPSAALAVCLIKHIIGKAQNADGSTGTGILGIVTKANDLINDYHARKKTNAETLLIEAQISKTNAETDLIKAQVAKTNAEVRALELQNYQISILASGKTTEEQRAENEELTIPTVEKIQESTEGILADANNLCNAAEIAGLNYAGEKIKKIG